MNTTQENAMNKLTADAVAAKAAAEAAAASSDDKGTSNLDAVFFRLDRYQRARGVLQSLQLAGLYVSEITHMGSRGILIEPPGGGSANRRNASMNALFRSLDGAGWNVSPWCRMD